MKTLWKIYKYVAVAVFSLFLVDAIIVIFISVYRPKIEQADAAVILGAAINTPALYNRSLEGLRLYQQGKAKVLVLSGGRISDKDISEAGYMEKVIQGNASTTVPLIFEDQSHSTYENIKNSKSKIPDAKSIIIVSDKFHLARAVLMAKRSGFEDVYWSSPKPVYYKTRELAFYYMREMVAMVSYIPKFILN